MVGSYILLHGTLGGWGSGRDKWVRKERIYCGLWKRAGNGHPSSGGDTDVSQVTSCVTRGKEESDRMCRSITFNGMHIFQRLWSSE